MWGIFFDACWKSVSTWIVGVLAIFVWSFLENMVRDIDYEESITNILARLWVIIGVVASIITFFAFIILIIISIWF